MIKFTNQDPVIVAELVRYILTALVAVGWINIPSTSVDVIVTAVGVVLSAALTVWTRMRVSPTGTAPPIVPPGTVTPPVV